MGDGRVTAVCTRTCVKYSLGLDVDGVYVRKRWMLGWSVDVSKIGLDLEVDVRSGGFIRG